jgi:hypothetical protein
MEEVKFLKASVDFDILLSTTRDAVELYFEGAGIPAKQEEEDTKQSMSTNPRLIIKYP